MIDQLFPDSVITVTTESTLNEPTGLLPEERSQIHRAVGKRQQEYAAGRRCARAALKRLGIHGFALVNDADRVPVWPDGIVGSVTHCLDFCGVAVTRRHPILGLGIDAEPIEPVESALESAVFNANEQLKLADLDGVERAVLFKIVFSAKESFYKAVFPLFRVPLEFLDVEIELGDDGTFHARSHVELPRSFDRLTARGRIVKSATHVFAGVTLSE